MPQRKYDGGQAFPGPGPLYNDMGDLTDAEFGMSLRDYFAGQALAGFIANDSVVEEGMVASWCYKQADAMIAARERSSDASD